MEFSLMSAIKLDEALQKKGIKRKIGIMHPTYQMFSLQELEQIEEFSVEGCMDISFLKQLSKLKKLTIRSHDYNRVIGEGQYQENDYFNQIEDFSVIRELKNLEELRIENDICIKELNVQGLEKLKNVYLINNPRLESILGLDEQHKLEHVVMYGNNIRSFSNIEAYLYNTMDAKQNILDVSIFFTFIESIETAKSFYDSDLMGLVNVSFAEKNGLVDYTTLSVEQITELYIHFRRLFDKKGLMKATDSDKIGYVFRYVVEYIRFAEVELQKREKLYAEILTEYQEIPEFYKKNLGSLHNSFNTCHFKRGNCEGIVNLMRFMLQIVNVESENVHCHDKRFRNSIDLNHALLRAKDNGKWLYYDATYDRKNIRHFFGKTFDELSDYVDLSVYERIVSEKGDYQIGQYHGKTFAK